MTASDNRRAGDSRSRDKRVPRRGLLPIVLVLVASTAMIALAWPRLISAVAETSFQETALSLASATPPSGEVVRRALAAKEQAASVHNSGRVWADIGLFRFHEAVRIGIATSDGRAALDASIDAHRRALTLEPSQAFALTRLAQAVLMRDGPAAPALPAMLAAAIEAAPYDSNLVVARVNVALAAWDYLRPDLQSITRQQIHIAADQSPTRLADAAARWFAFQRIIVMLSDDPRLLKRFVVAYTRL